MEINLNKSTMFELKVLRSENSEEFTKISFYKNRGFRDWEKYEGWEVEKRLNATDSIVSIDSSHSSLDPDVLSRPPESAPFYIEENEKLFLRVFIDKSVLEVFVNERQCVATRVYPSKKDSIGVSVLSKGSNSKIISLDAYDMKNIYKK
jgi:beta-fructofuranosidase